MRAIGAKNATWGAIWCIAGIVITAVTFEAASSSHGGGTYFVAYGAIIFGAIQFFKGMFQLAVGR